MISLSEPTHESTHAALVRSAAQWSTSARTRSSPGLSRSASALTSGERSATLRPDAYKTMAKSIALRICGCLSPSGLGRLAPEQG